MTRQMKGTAVQDYWQNYIDGAWVDRGAGRIAVADPATGERRRSPTRGRGPCCPCGTAGA